MATLRNINLEVRPGEKVAICGEVGSGKSTLLAAILGEVPKIQGTVSDYYSFYLILSFQAQNTTLLLLELSLIICIPTLQFPAIAMHPYDINAVLI